jgi:hypothetical protein
MPTGSSSVPSTTTIHNPFSPAKGSGVTSQSIKNIQTYGNRFFVYPIWPRYSLNGVIGASSSGKSRWIIPQLYDLLDAETVLDEYPVDPDNRPKIIAYIDCNRTMDEVVSLIESGKRDPNRLILNGYIDQDNNSWSVGMLQEMIPADCDLCYIEGISALLQKKTVVDDRAVRELRRELNVITNMYGCSFWGSFLTPKMKAGEFYINARENVSGSGIWPGVLNTEAYIVGDQNTATREVRIHTMSRLPIIQPSRFDENSDLVPYQAKLVENPSLAARLAACPPDTTILTSEVVQWADELGLTSKTAQRWLKQQSEVGDLIKLKHGIYKTLS